MIDTTSSATNAAWPRYLLWAVCLAAIAIRPPLTIVGPLAELIGLHSGLSAAAIGGLTTLPLLVFVVVSPWVPQLAQKLGMARVLVIGLACMVLGSLVRWQPSLPALYIGTALIAMGIGAGNVLLPAIVRRYFPDRIGGLTSLYATLMTLAGGAASSIAVPLAAGLALGWPATIALPGVLALLAMLAWLPLQRQERFEATNTGTSARVWRSGLAWSVAIFFGLQGMIFYSMIAWMAPMLTQKGLSLGDAGFVVGAFGVVGIVSSIVVPVLAVQRPSQRLLAVALGFGQFACGLGLYLSSGSIAAGFAVAFGLFTTGAFTLCFVLFAVRARSSSASTALSGMAQSLGYALAAGGPLLLGILFDATASWSAAGLAIIAMTIGTIGSGFIAGSKAFVD